MLPKALKNCPKSNKSPNLGTLIRIRTKAEVPGRIQKLQSSRRSYTSDVINGSIFTQATNHYDAYEKDIALVTVFFESVTVFQYGTQLRLTW